MLPSPIACLLASQLAAGASMAAGPGSPEVRSVQPSGGQRGTEVVLTLSGERLDSAQGLLWHGRGITTLSVENKDAKTVLARLRLESDCPLGEHLLRLRTATGLSELRSILVGALPTLDEIEPNGDMASAQAVPLNTTVNGVITREDADYFKVQARAGQRLSVEIEALRLGRAMFDPAIAILDERRFELAVSDDSPLLGQDSSASIKVPADGTYYVMVRDAAYGGDPTSQYRLHIGEFPRPHLAWPPGGPPGQSVTPEWKGDPTGLLLAMPAANVDAGKPASEPMKAPIFTPSVADVGLMPIHAVDATGTAPSPNWYCVSPLAIFPSSTPQGQEPPSAPAAFHGTLTGDHPQARVTFKAKGGQALDVRLLSRRLRSPMDGVLEIVDAKGASLASNDDASGADPEVRFTPPADGTYEARVRDHRGRFGEEFIYRLEIEPPRPTLSLNLERVDNRRPQFLQSICVPRGGSFAAMVKAERKDVGGEVRLDATDLPAGVTMTALAVPGDLGSAPVLFEAAADAPLSGTLASLTGTIGDLKGGFSQSMPLVIAPPNETVYYQTHIDRLATTVTERAPYRVTLEQPSTPLLRVGMKQLDVKVERDAGFAGDVVVQMLWNPPGTSSAGSITIPAGQTKGQYLINASGDAPLKPWKLCLLGHASVQGGDLWTSSRFAELQVADLYLNGAIQMAATEQGKPVSVVCTLTQVRAFEGKAKLTLLGLPAKTECAPVEVAAGTSEATFNVTLASDTPPGQHRGLFIELELPTPTGVVNHRFGFGGVLRVDAPAPAPVAAAPKPKSEATVAAAPPPPPAPAKPLSRLEQLRKQAQERSGGTPK